MAMKIVGRVQLTIAQSNSLSDGGTIDLPLPQFRELVPHGVAIGDLVWVQEPHFTFSPKRSLAFDAIVVPGPSPAGWHAPVRRPAPWGEMRLSRGKAKFLRRKHSRATLEVMGYVSAGGSVRCLVHMRQVDAFVQARVAA